MSEINRVVVFTSDLNHNVRKHIIKLDQQLGGVEWLIIEHIPNRSLSQIARRQWRNLQRHGWRRIPALGRAVMKRFGGRLVSAPDRAPGRVYAAETFGVLPRFHVETVSKLGDPDVIARVQQFVPDLGLSLAAPILRPELFAIPRLGTLNLHKGKVPEYRGMPPAFWELWNNEQSVGCTVHWVEEGLDTGAVAATGSVERARYSTVVGLQLTLDQLGITMMNRTVAALASGQRVSIPQQPGGTTYRQPTLSQVSLLNRRLESGLPFGQSRGRRIAKDIFRGTLLRIGSHGRSKFTSPRVTVLLYHRVTDSVRDNLTVGIEQFDRQMMLLRRHFNLIDLPDLIEMERVPRTDRPTVCVTFDDGYLDNFTNAAPILLRHQVPATFFVATGLIGTTRQFPHDVRRGNPPIPLMNWDHLREMHSEGFTIGSHTVNHIDCASEATETVRSELQESRETLRHELGLDRLIFSYPYGDRHHMTPERLELVKEEGYVGCVSAYGGINKGTINRFNVVRQGVHWEASDTAFLFTASGLWK